MHIVVLLAQKRVLALRRVMSILLVCISRAACSLKKMKDVMNSKNNLFLLNRERPPSSTLLNVAIVFDRAICGKGLLDFE